MKWEQVTEGDMGGEGCVGVVVGGHRFSHLQVCLLNTLPNPQCSLYGQ